MKAVSEKKKGAVLDPGNILVVLYVGLVMVLVVLALLQDVAAAQVLAAKNEVSLAEVRQGELLFTGSAEGKYVPAPHLSQDVEIYVSGMIVRSIVRQRFQNDTDQWQEAIYVFPLPSESAVDQLRMRIGERVIAGEIEEKEEAKKLYEKARKDGKKASLLSQERPNIFTMSVANIAPGEEVEVEIEYQDVVQRDSTVFSLRFPLVVGPRYIPGRSRTTSFSGTGWAMDTNQVADASRITPPVAVDRPERLNPVHLMVELAAGFPLARVESLYHAVTISETVQGSRQIVLTGDAVADRDFVLEWEGEKLSHPHAALFTETHQGKEYLLLMLMPQTLNEDSTALPRELVFILDTSGSMAGPSLVQAKKALTLAISRLTDGDRFNVIEFNSNASQLFRSAVVADRDHRNKAMAFVEGLAAEGGTEIATAFTLALDGRNDHSRIRQIVFLTDGCVGNEAQLLTQINSGLGTSRLFTVGIGSAPNSYFMSRAAAMGRGSFTYIGKVEEVQEKMNGLFSKLEHLAVSGISLSNSDGKIMEIYPHPVPDLYQGEPLLVTLQQPEGYGKLQVRGQMGGILWQENLDISGTADRPGIATLWARRKIRSLMDSVALGADKEDIRAKVLEVAIAHHLVSRYTSLVAVEKQVSRPSAEALQRAVLKSNLPSGWQAKKIFAGTAKTATPAMLHIFVGIALLFSSLFFMWRMQGREQ